MQITTAIINKVKILTTKYRQAVDRFQILVTPINFLAIKSQKNLKFPIKWCLQMIFILNNNSNSNNSIINGLCYSSNSPNSFNSSNFYNINNLWCNNSNWYIQILTTITTTTLDFLCLQIWWLSKKIQRKRISKKTITLLQQIILIREVLYILIIWVTWIII